MKTFVLFLMLILLTSCSQTISNFEECIDAGNPVMESYPRQCNNGKQTFTEVVEDMWKYDGVELLEHNETGELGCFGCSSVEAKTPMCIDPISEMKPIQETYELHCNEDFEIVKNE